MAARPFSATETSCPSRLSRIASISRIERSSSTTRMRADSLAVAAVAGVTMPAMSGVPLADVGDRPLVGGVGLADGQRHLDAGPLPLLRGHANLAAVVARNPMDDGEAETGAVGEPAAERLEHAVDVLGGDADPLVVDADDHLGSPAAAAGPGLHPQAELPAGRHRAQAVGREVPDDLPA